MERSLWEVLVELPDFRQAKGKRHQLAKVVVLVVMGLICGQNSLPQIAKWGQGLDRATRSRIGNRHGKVASYSTLRRVLLGLDESALAQALQGWVEEVVALAGQPPELMGLAVDGKTLRGSGHDQAEIAALQVLNAVVHSQPVPAQTNELGAMPDFLDQLLLTERVVTTDALHAQRDQAETILEKGGTIYCGLSRTKGALFPL